MNNLAGFYGKNQAIFLPEGALFGKGLGGQVQLLAITGVLVNV
jgi:hypothetical protein